MDLMHLIILFLMNTRMQNCTQQQMHALSLSRITKLSLVRACKGEFMPC